MTTALHRTDAELKTAVTAELRWVPGIDAAHIGVAVTHGAVTLSGEVASYPEKVAAGAAAQRVRGVGALVQSIVVHHPWAAVTDSDIAQLAAQALTRSVTVPDSVSVAVHDHEITLTGAVGWHYQREAAAEAVALLRGVTSVVNLVSLSPQGSPVAVANAIRAALVRSAEVESDLVEVHVVGGVVTLSGSVRTWSERRQAQDAAWSAPGVTAVTDELVVTG